MQLLFVVRISVHLKDLKVDMVCLLFLALPKRNWGIQKRVQPISLSVQMSSCPHLFLHDGLIDFLHIRYHEEVPWAADACKIEFGSVPHLSNCGYFSYIVSVCCDISATNVVIFLFIFGTVIRYHVLLMIVKQHLAMCQIEVIMATFYYILCICCAISKTNWLILSILGRVFKSCMMCC